MVNAGIYARISDDFGGDGLGVKRQLRECRKRLEDLGWVEVDAYIDNSRSAFTGKPRPEWKRLLGDIKSGRIEAVIAFQMDRLIRQPRELEQLIDLCEEVGVSEVKTVDGTLDLSTPIGRTQARIYGSLANQESEIKRIRARSKALEKAEKGEYQGGGVRLFGYSQDRKTMNQGEAVRLRNIAKRVLAGSTIFSEVKRLNSAEVTTTAGNEWTTSSLRRLLLSPAIAGLREHAEAGRVKASWKGIISEREHDALVALFNGRRRGKSVSTYLLTGLLICSTCGAKLVSTPHQKGGRIYRCPTPVAKPGSVKAGSCEGRSLSGERADEMVAEMVLAALDRAVLQGEEGDETEAMERVREIRARRELMAEMLAEGQIDAVEWKSIRNSLIKQEQKALKEAERAVEALKPQGVSGVGVRDNWAHLSVTERRSVVERLIDHILVGKYERSGRTRWDPSRLTLIWRA